MVIPSYKRKVLKNNVILRKRRRRPLIKKKRRKSSSEDIFSEMDVAHSSDIENGILYTQTYKEHSTEVKHRALKCFDEAAKYLLLDKTIIEAMREIIEVSTEYHDIGKLDELAQEVIKGGHKKKMLNHVDAGVAVLLQRYKETCNVNYLISAILLDAHHLGILNKVLNEHRETGETREFPKFMNVFENPEKILRSNKKVIDKYSYYKKYLKNNNETVKEYVNRTLYRLLERHNKWIEDSKKNINSSGIPILDHPMIMRFLLSCLVEGDHWDTSRHYGQIAPDIVTFPFSPNKRIKHYDEKYGVLTKESDDTKKNRVRRLVKEDCEEVDLSYNFYGIYAYPSYGKTLASGKLALLLCEEYNLRGVIYVAPFNNILFQNIEEYENFLCLHNEKKTEVIGEHYQDATHFERAKKDAMYYKLVRHYGIFWQCPFEIVSAVGLLETIASNHPSSLRKFHQLAGRVIILDEFHTMVPTNLLRQTLKWLKILTEEYGCKIVFMSGSPVKFWEIDDLKSCDIKIKEVLTDETIIAMDSIEKRRVKYSRFKRRFKSFASLSKKIMSKPGPRVVVFNTVTSAAAFANYVSKKYGRDKVMHLSTSLTPKDRKKIMKDVEERLKKSQKNEDTDWVLVATSCIETGVNLSFRTGFRESNCLLSLFQLGGRVNRSNEYGVNCYVYSFKFNHDYEGTTNNLAFNSSVAILDQFFEENLINYKYCTEAIRRELMRRNADTEEMKKIEEFEKDLNYGSVASLYNIIPHAYKSIVVGYNTKNKVEEGREIVSYKEIIENSVQIFYTKTDRVEYSSNIRIIDEEGIPTEKYLEAKIKAPKEFNIWTGEYDPDFLGYMKDILISMGHNVE